MNRTTAVIIGAVLTLAAIFAYAHRGPQVEISSPDAANNAAFRDGMYQAQLDDQLVRKPHLRTGRWSSDQDRASFLAGYQLASAQFASASNEDTSTFRQGVKDGIDARHSQRPFAAQTDFSRFAQNVSGNGEAKVDIARLYADGYQLGYYGASDAIQSADLAQASGE